MPVNIFDIPSEEKTSQKALSLWVEFGICVCIIAVYVMVCLSVYFSSIYQKIIMFSGLDVLLVPLLLSGAVFFF
ncbi:hypothetical protein [Klebsiella pneumoniae]|uniref:hypothetical protein n=1 Tax=Klebsiella pneumoniae TaxID=573 RepID=UPI0039E9327A